MQAGRKAWRAEAERIVYVSCNPTTLARDAASSPSGVMRSPGAPVDMFPHTHHIEIVALFTRDA